jgi:hypothetical protein
MRFKKSLTVITDSTDVGRHAGPVPPVSFLWYHQLARQVGPMGFGVRLP